MINIIYIIMYSTMTIFDMGSMAICLFFFLYVCKMAFTTFKKIFITIYVEYYKITNELYLLSENINTIKNQFIQINNKLTTITNITNTKAITDAILKTMETCLAGSNSGSLFEKMVNIGKQLKDMYKPKPYYSNMYACPDDLPFNKKPQHPNNFFKPDDLPFNKKPQHPNNFFKDDYITNNINNKDMNSSNHDGYDNPCIANTNQFDKNSKMQYDTYAVNSPFVATNHHFPGFNEMKIGKPAKSPVITNENDLSNINDYEDFADDTETETELVVN
jgi:hypothetical protein